MGKDTIELNQRKEYLQNTDPFEIALDYYKSLTSDEDWLLTARLFSLYNDWIQAKFKEHDAESLVLCGRRVVFSSSNRYEPTDEQISELEARMGKPCYVVAREPLIEERVGWLELPKGDYYPTLEIYLGNRDIMLELLVKITLDPETRESVWELL